MAWRKPNHDMRWDISVDESSTVSLKYGEFTSQKLGQGLIRMWDSMSMSCAWDRNSSSITTKTAVVKWQGQYDVNRRSRSNCQRMRATTIVGRQNMGHFFNPCLVKGWGLDQRV